MGLDTSHDCWHGSYSSFSRFREKICEAAGLGKLDDYQSYGGDKLWPDDPIVILLNHSDCDGEIWWQDCKPLADSMEALLPRLAANDSPGMPCFTTRNNAKQFIEGLRMAHISKENVEFH